MDVTEFLLPRTDPPTISLIATTDGHTLTADCPLACLRGLLSPQTLARLLTEPLPGQVSTIADVAASYRTGTLSEIPGIGPGRTAEVEDLLLAAGLVSSGECYVAAAASEMARRRRNWLAVIDGPVIGYLRQSDGLSQALVARISRLGVSAIARIENEPASYCHRRTLDRLARALRVPAGGLEHPAHLTRRPR